MRKHSETDVVVENIKLGTHIECGIEATSICFRRGCQNAIRSLGIALPFIKIKAFIVEVNRQVSSHSTLIGPLYKSQVGNGGTNLKSIVKKAYLCAQIDSNTTALKILKLRSVCYQACKSNIITRQITIVCQNTATTHISTQHCRNAATINIGCHIGK